MASKKTTTKPQGGRQGGPDGSRGYEQIKPPPAPPPKKESSSGDGKK